MLTAQLSSIVKQLKNHSASLAKSNLLLDKPWTIIDGDNEIQRLIFKKDKTLILSKNGQAQIGKWDYFPEAQSLLLDRISDKILCNEAFIDEGVLILKLDGTDNQFFTLANENVIPDLNIGKYLNFIRRQKLFICEKKLVDGKILEIETSDGSATIQIGNEVSINDDVVKDGTYQITDKKIYEVKNNKIIQIFTIKIHRTSDETEITIHQKKYWEIFIGDRVFINSEVAENQSIKLKKGRILLIHNGEITDIKWKSKLHCFFYKLIH